MMGHNGQFGGFLKEVRENGGMQSELMDQTNLPVILLGFDGSPVYDDGQEPEVVIGEEESSGSGADSVETEVSAGEGSSETVTESAAEPQSTEETGAAAN